MNIATPETGYHFNVMRRAIDLIRNDFFSLTEPGVFRPIVANLLEHGDYYMNLADLRSFTVQQLEQRLGSQDVRRLLEASSTQRVRAILARLGADPTLDGLPFERWQALSAQVGATFACKPSERFAPDRKPCR